MPVYFLDTSALVKRYVNETGSAWVDGLTDPTAGNDVYILRLTEVEVTSAVTRRRRAGTLSVTNAATVLAQFRRDLAAQYYVIDITSGLLATAVLLVETYGLRAYDAVQLATATTLNVHRVALSLTNLTFVSADQENRKYKATATFSPRRTLAALPSPIRRGMSRPRFAARRRARGTAGSGELSCAPMAITYAMSSSYCI